MNIRLGIYDIFSRIVPGGFYLLAFIQFAIVLDLMQFDWRSFADIGVFLSFGLVVIVYILGTVLDPLSSAWHRLFAKRGISARVLNECKQVHADRWVIDFEDKDWPILRAYIGIQKPDVASDIDRNNALCIMLRNISFGLFLVASSEIIQFAKSLDWIHVLLAVVFVVFSFQTAIQVRTGRHWFYSGILETVLAFRLDLEERVKPIGRRKK